MAFVTVFSKTIHLPVAGVLDVEGAGQMGTLTSSAGQQTRWSFNLIIDGELVWNPGGNGPLDCCYLGGLKYCDPGDRLIELKWIADPTVTLGKAFLKIRGFNNTTGV